MKKLNSQEAKLIGNDLVVNWNEIKLEEFTKGVSVELEHGTKYPETNGTNNDKILTKKITWAHFKEFSEYYTRLEKLESEAGEFWKKKGRV